MYEENLKPLPTGDATLVFADILATLQQNCETWQCEPITPEHVVQWAKRDIQPYLAAICRRLLLPGSCLVGFAQLAELANLARGGKPCLLCLNHRSNLDVPTLYALMEDQADLDVFHQIIWIAGRKLQEDVGLTKLMVQGVNRVVLTPKSWLDRDDHSEEQLHEAHQLNLAAHRAIHQLRTEGWIFALFPAGTRTRPQDESTARAIEETDSYLKSFEFMLLGNIRGCTLPVSRDQDLTHETPTRDRMQYTFGRVLRTAAWRRAAARRFPGQSQRAATARAIMADIQALVPAPVS